MIHDSLIDELKREATVGLSKRGRMIEVPAPVLAELIQEIEAHRLMLRVERRKVEPPFRWKNCLAFVARLCHTPRP